MSLYNKLQTKRELGVDNLINWGLYTDWRLDPRTNQTRFSDFYSDLDLKPRAWLVINSEIRYNVADNNLRETLHRILIAPKRQPWSISLSHRYLINNDPEFTTPTNPNVPGYNTFTSSLYYRMNENWGARVSHRFEARDGKMEEQYYTIYRDLRSWTSALTLRIRQQSGGIGSPSDVTVAITFSLKSFPRMGLGADADRPSMLLGS